MEPDDTSITTTYTGQACLLGIVLLIGLPMLGFSAYAALFGGHLRPDDRLGGAIATGIIGLFTVLVGYGMASFRVKLANGVLSQRGFLTKRRDLPLNQVTGILLRNQPGQSRMLEQLIVIGPAGSIRMVDSFRDYDRLRDTILRGAPQARVEDSRIHKSPRPD